MSSTDNFTKLDPGLRGPAKAMRRKRFLAVSIAALGVLAVAMGVSFLGDTGSTELSVSTSTSSEFVFPVTGSGFGGTTEVKEAVEKLANESTTSSGKLPSWSLGIGTAGEVSNAGDLALVHTIGTSLVVNVYVTNLAALQGDYSSFAFPVKVYEVTECKTAKCIIASSWKEDAALSKTYLTNTEGDLSFSLESGKYYDITIAKGGSYYAFSTSGSASPAFYFTAQAV